MSGTKINNFLFIYFFQTAYCLEFHQIHKKYDITAYLSKLMGFYKIYRVTTKEYIVTFYFYGMKKKGETC
jgi:hypothetical protein